MTIETVKHVVTLTATEVEAALYESCVEKYPPEWSDSGSVDWNFKSDGEVSVTLLQELDL